MRRGCGTVSDLGCYLFGSTHFYRVAEKIRLDAVLTEAGAQMGTARGLFDWQVPEGSVYQRT